MVTRITVLFKCLPVGKGNAKCVLNPHETIQRKTQCTEWCEKGHSLGCENRSMQRSALLTQTPKLLEFLFGCVVDCWSRGVTNIGTRDHKVKKLGDWNYYVCRYLVGILQENKSLPSNREVTSWKLSHMMLLLAFWLKLYSCKSLSC